MFYIKSKNKRTNLLIGILFAIGVLFSSVKINQPSLSMLQQHEILTQKVLHIDNEEKTSYPNIIEAKWDGTFSGLFSIHFGRKGSGHGKIVLFGFVLYDGQNK